MAGDTATLTRTGESAGNKRNPRYDILFEPVKIGPVTAPNRFYQVPHASGMTNALPRVRAKFRETKAEGGWGVVCTGACSIDLSPPLPSPEAQDQGDAAVTISLCPGETDRLDINGKQVCPCPGRRTHSAFISIKYIVLWYPSLTLWASILISVHAYLHSVQINALPVCYGYILYSLPESSITLPQHKT